MISVEDLHEQMSRLQQSMSKFQLYSKGIVAENKPTTTNEVLVIPVERMGFLEGEIATEDSDLDIKGVDGSGKPYTVTMQARSALTCQWLPMDSNRVTAPDVRRGEEVFIYRFADSDDFYWVDTGLAAKLRRLETVAWLFSANPTGDSDDERSPADSYLFEVSAHKKLITLQTTKKNEEPFAYTIQLNTATGYFTITDDAGNFVELDSAEKRIKAELNTGTYIEANQQDINLFAPGDINGTAEGDINLQCVNFNLKADGEVNVTSEGNTNITAAKVVVDTPITEFTGSVKIAQDLEVGGNAQVEGTLKVTGAMQLGSSVTGPSFNITDGILTCKSMVASMPISAPNV